MMLPNAVRAAIFDMDGTLLDSERFYLRAIREACLAVGLEAPEAFFFQMLGRPWPDCYRMLGARFGAGFERSRFDPLFDQGFAQLTRGGIPLKPGVRELLEHLASLETPMAVATSTGGALAKRHLEHAGILDFFAARVSADMVAEPKPAPETFRKASEALGVASHYCLALEDSPAGVRSAAASGAMTIMVPDMVPATVAEQSVCVAVVKTMFDVLDCLRAGENATPSLVER
ncbi:HAD family phosphatase [Methylocystis sp. 9N]|uniref:HAD family phosphatase n=1 Tax=Methylocystis borbori TaxID=3118750 RepID=A0ABU7XFH6_9HYPH